MLTANAVKSVEKQYRKRHVRKGFPWWQVILLVPFWLCVGAFAAMCLKSLLFQSSHDNLEVFLAAGVAFGMLLFSFIPLQPIYVIGHELTHWLAAKITFHKTGKIKLKWNHGCIEIIDPNGFIALAPYWVPFFFLLSACIAAFVMAMWGNRMTMHARQGTACWLGLMYAYHIALTIRALRCGQKDMEYCGKFLSWCIIVSMNLVTAFLAFAVASSDPLNAFAIPWRLAKSLLSVYFN